MSTPSRVFSLLTLCVLLAVTRSSFGAAKRHYEIGLQLYTVRDDCAKDFEGTLKAVGAMGYGGVEFAGYYGKSAPELKKMLEDDHLKCFGSHISLDDLMGDNFDKTVAFSQALGNHMLVVPSLPESRMNTHAAIVDTANLFTQLARRLSKYHIILAYHNHRTEFRPVEGELPWNTFFNHADPIVKIELDIGHAMAAGYQAAPLVEQYPGRVIAVHLKDYSADRDVLLGEGDEKWSEVLPVLKGKGGTRYFIVEQETYPFPPLVCAEKCLRNFEKMIQ